MGLLKRSGNNNIKVFLPLSLNIGRINSITPFNRNILSQYRKIDESYDFTNYFDKLKNNCLEDSISIYYQNVYEYLKLLYENVDNLINRIKLEGNSKEKNEVGNINLEDILNNDFNNIVYELKRLIIYLNTIIINIENRNNLNDNIVDLSKIKIMKLNR